MLTQSRLTLTAAYTAAMLGIGFVAGVNSDGKPGHIPVAAPSPSNWVATDPDLAARKGGDPNWSPCHYPLQPTDDKACQLSLNVPGVLGKDDVSPYPETIGAPPANPGRHGHEYRDRWEWMPSINRWMAFDGSEFQFSPEIPPDGNDHL